MNAVHIVNLEFSRTGKFLTTFKEIEKFSRSLIKLSELWTAGLAYGFFFGKFCTNPYKHDIMMYAPL